MAKHIKKKLTPVERHINVKLEDRIVAAELRAAGLERELAVAQATIKTLQEDAKQDATRQSLIDANKKLASRNQHQRLRIGKLQRAVTRESILVDGFKQIVDEQADILKRTKDNKSIQSAVHPIRTDAKMALQESDRTKGILLAVMLPGVYA